MAEKEIKPKHTQGEWEFKKNNFSSDIVDEQGYDVCSMTSGSKSINKTNAQRIITCVNKYEEIENERDSLQAQNNILNNQMIVLLPSYDSMREALEIMAEALKAGDINKRSTTFAITGENKTYLSIVKDALKFKLAKNKK